MHAQNPQLHASFAWALGNVKRLSTEPDAAPAPASAEGAQLEHSPEVARTWGGVLSQPVMFSVAQVHCRVGKDVYSFALKSAS